MPEHTMPVSDQVLEFVMNAEGELKDAFMAIEEIEAHNQWKVLSAFQEEGIAQRHFAPTTGYGYDDIGRDALDRVFARAMGAEDALVRPQIANGTQAIYLALAGLLQPGDTLISATGKPYDTLVEAIAGDVTGSLKNMGVSYREIGLPANGTIDMEAVEKEILANPRVKVVFFQRSRGYAWREALSLEELQNAFTRIRALTKDVSIVVDNCYGEFTQTKEPTDIGADLIAGSFIKNPGGGLAPTGGYVAGSTKAVEMAAQRLTVPGIGREVGSYASSYLPFFQGLFIAPHVCAQSLKSAALFARVFENLGMTTMPHSEAARSDIIQALRLPSAEALIAFVQSIQQTAPVDSFVTPEPWAMPGYRDQVIMAAGTFIQGASIELSADAPIKAPYTAYIQGALTYAHGRIGVMLALESLRKNLGVLPE